MHSNDAASRFIFGQLDELLLDGRGRHRSINEEEVRVLNSIFTKLCSIILRFVKPDNMGHIKVLENLQVVFWRVLPRLTGSAIDWTHEGHELVGNDEI